MNAVPPPGPGSTISERLQWARKHLRGFSSDRAAAEALRFVVSTYRKHESGERGADGMKQHHIDRYAKALKVNPVWLQTGQGSHERISTMADLTDDERRLIEAFRAAKLA
jgi:hypothetical protein